MVIFNSKLLVYRRVTTKESPISWWISDQEPGADIFRDWDWEGIARWERGKSRSSRCCVLNALDAVEVKDFNEK